MKIDVEGFEKQVLTGLSHEIECFSMECESTAPSVECIELIDDRYDAEYQFVVGENRFFALTGWADKRQIIEFIKWAMPQDPNFFGDIYVRSKRLHQESLEKASS